MRVRKFFLPSFIALSGLVLFGCTPENNPSFISEMVCEPPCWQGIEPGITTEVEAILILKARPDIDPNSVSTHGEPWWIFNNILYFESSSGDWEGEVYILDDKVVMQTFFGDLGINFSEAIEKIGKPEFVINIPTSLGYSISAFDPVIGTEFTFDTAGVPKRKRSELIPESPITMVSYFDPSRYDELLDGEMFSMGFLGKEKTFKYLHPWAGYGSIAQKYPHAIIGSESKEGKPSETRFYGTAALTLGDSRIIMIQPQTKQTHVIQFDPQLYTSRRVSEITAACELIIQVQTRDSNQILRADQTGKILELLYQSPIQDGSTSRYSPVISPSQRYVAYVVFSGEQFYDTAQFQDVEVAPVDGSSPPVRLTEHGGASSNGGTWSPDGEIIAYTDYDDDGFLQLYATDLSDWTETKLTHFQEKKSPGSVIEWAPSGQYLAVILKNAVEVDEIWVYSTVDNRYFEIDLPSRIMELSDTLYWSMDGRTLLVLAQDFENRKIAGLYWFDIPYQQLIRHLSEEQAGKLSLNFQTFAFIFPLTTDLSQLAFYNSSGLWQFYDTGEGVLGDLSWLSGYKWGSHINVTTFAQDFTECK